MILDAYASEAQYRAAVRPVFDAIPYGNRGTWGLEGHGDAVLVSSYNDYRTVRNRPVIFMEHGVGQTYGEGLVSYAGSRRRQGIVAFLDPNDSVRALNAHAHPSVPGAVVGTPRMDPYWKLQPRRGVVALAWHWDAQVVPETRSALWHYAPVFDELADRFIVLGTAHPRIAQEAQHIYAATGIQWATLDEVYRNAAMVVADNTTVGWDFVGLDRPVVWANAPSYRKFISHGLRFWDDVDTGVEVDTPEDLVAAVSEALLDDNAQRRARRRLVGAKLYPYRDGTAAVRAAAAVLELVEAR